MSERTFTFDTPDFNESVSWVTQAMSNNDNNKIIMSFYNNEIKFSYRDRTIFLESSCATGNVEGEEGSLQLNATSLARFLKVLPKTAPTVTLKEEKNNDNNVTSLTAKSGNIKAKIACVNGRKPKKPEYFTTATINSTDFFPKFARAGASANTNKESNSVLSAIDCAINDNNEHMTIFGTDSFIMNISNVDCHIINNDDFDNSENFENKVRGKHFLIPAHFSSLKSLASYSKIEETVEIIVGVEKQQSLGFSFPNGSVCLFTCINTEHIKAAQKIFDVTKKTVNKNFIVDVKEFRNSIRNITSLNPESETIQLTVKKYSLTVSDSRSENLVKFPINVKDNNDNDSEEFSLHNLKFSTFIITKMFNAIGSKECTVNFSTNSDKAILITYETEKTTKSVSKTDVIDDRQTRIIVALYK